MTTRRPRIAPCLTAAEEAPRAPRRRVPHVITVTSGKGGVGKTNFTANLGWQLRQIRRNVMILDADLGLANIDIILGLTPDFNLSHVLSGEKTLGDIITRGPGGLRILPAGSGLPGVTDLTDAQKMALLAQMEALEQDFDYFLIDTGAGIAGNVIYFSLAAQTMIVMVTPEPTSLTDAYALVKVLSREYHQRRFKVVANEVTDEAEGREVFQNLTRVTDRFLDVSLDYLGHIPHDPKLRNAVRMQRPFCEVFPEAPAAQAIRRIARRVSTLQNDPLNSDLGLLWRNVLVREGTA
ncbi:MAG: MinD/ParA family protein [bacterium]|nr:MinD/ParA family protein [bacterium]